ncbi:unnamed protein product [Caenorhabditis brenneri]
MTTSLDQLHVKNLSVQAPKVELLSSILRSLKPEFLTMIDFDIHELRNDGIPCHFKQFSVRLEQLTVEDVWEMKEILFKSPIFKNCTLTCDLIDVNAIGQELAIFTQIVRILSIFQRMPEFLKSHPMALHHCILYEFLQGKSAEWAFDDFCKTVGDDIIDKEEFQFWFNRFADGRFYKKEAKEPITDISSILRNDKYALRACVYYESKSEEMGEKPFLERYNLLLYERNNHSVFGKYQKFCKTIGENSMDFSEFDYWFYRFLNGESIDLNSERDENKRIYELADMPIYVVEKIMEHLDIVDRLALKKTSKSLRSLINNQKFLHDSIDFELNDDKARIRLYCEPDRLKYTQIDENECLESSLGTKEKKVGGASWRLASQDLKACLEMAKLRNLTIKLKNFSEFEVFDGLENSRIYAKTLNFEVDTLEPIVKILPYFHPGTLEILNFKIKKSNAPLISKIVEMDQWKQAKEFKMRGSVFRSPIQNLFHFTNFDVSLGSVVSVEENIRQVKEILFKLPHFDACRLRFPHSPATLLALKSQFGEHLPDEPRTYHHRIPDSEEKNQYFVIDLLFDTVDISRETDDE